MAGNDDTQLLIEIQKAIDDLKAAMPNFKVREGRARNTLENIERALKNMAAPPYSSKGMFMVDPMTSTLYYLNWTGIELDIVLRKGDEMTNVSAAQAPPLVAVAAFEAQPEFLNDLLAQVKK